MANDHPAASPGLAAESTLLPAARAAPSGRRIALAFWTLVALCYVVPKLFGAHTTDLTRDPAALAEHPVWYGMLSNLGVLGWCVTAAVCLFTAGLLRPGGPVGARAFLGWSGSGVGFLLVDDLFLLHDRIGPRHLGLAGWVFYAAYAAVLAVLAVRFSAFVVHSTPCKLLFLALALLGASMLIDLGWLPGSTGQEDLVKFLGIAALAHYFVATSSAVLRAARA